MGNPGGRARVPPAAPCLTSNRTPRARAPTNSADRPVVGRLHFRSSPFPVASVPLTSAAAARAASGSRLFVLYDQVGQVDVGRAPPPARFLRRFVRGVVN